MKFCAICKKSSLLAGGYSNRTRATKFNPTGIRRRQPNLHWVRLGDGRRLRLCTRCLKSGRHLSLIKKRAPDPQRNLELNSTVLPK